MVPTVMLLVLPPSPRRYRPLQRQPTPAASDKLDRSAQSNVTGARSRVTPRPPPHPIQVRRRHVRHGPPISSFRRGARSSVHAPGLGPVRPNGSCCSAPTTCFNSGAPPRPPPADRHQSPGAARHPHATGPIVLIFATVGCPAMAAATCGASAQQALICRASLGGHRGSFRRSPLSLANVLCLQVVDGWALDDLAVVGVAGAMARAVPAALGRVPGHQAAEMGAAPRDGLPPGSR